MNEFFSHSFAHVSVAKGTTEAREMMKVFKVDQLSSHDAFLWANVNDKIDDVAKDCNFYETEVFVIQHW